MHLVVGGTDKGLVRANNQDRFEGAVLSDALAFAVVCDGIGGENGGNIAADIAASFAASMLRRDLTEGMSELSLRSILYSAFSGANALVQEKAKEDEELSGMGTTMIIAVRSGNTLYVSHVGDSRVYLVSAEREVMLTRDHTLVQMLIDSGKLGEEEALTHPKRHYLTRAVGVAPVLDVDFLVQPLRPEEIVLLCSDGLYHYLEPGEIYPLVRGALDQQDVQGLIEHAKQGGGGDNITAVVMG